MSIGINHTFNYFYYRQYSITKSFYFSLFICSLFVFPILYANIYYYDDISRAKDTFLGWEAVGRPLASVTLALFNLNQGGLLDVSPLPLLLSLVILAASIIIIAKGVFGEYTFKSLVTSSVCIISPLLLQNLAYRFDSLPMVLSIFFAILAWRLLSVNQTFSPALSLLLLFASLNLYQTCAPVFMILALARIMISSYTDRNESSRDFTKALSITFAAYVLYYFITYKFISNSISKVIVKRSELIFSHSEWPSLLLINVKKVLAIFASAFANIHFAVIAAFIILSTLLSIWLCLRRGGNAKFFAAFFIPIGLFLSCFTVVFLQESYMPPRVFPTLGFLIFCTLLPFYHLKKTISLLATLLSVYLIFIAIITSFSFGSALKAQDNYDSSIIMMIRSDLLNNNVLIGRATRVYGKSHDSPRQAGIIARVPLIEQMRNNIYDWTGSMLLGQAGVENVLLKFDDRKHMRDMMNNVCLQGQRPIVHNALYAIFDVQNINIVWLGYDADKCSLN